MIGRNSPVGGVVAMLMVSDVALTELPLLGLKVHVDSPGKPVQV
jgi:hypothetical protein